MDKKRYEGLDGMRAIACIAVIMNHVYGNGKYEVGRIIPGITKFSPVFVLLFMTISGFGMCCGYFDKAVNGKLDYSDFYKKRYSKIWPFFAFLCFIDIILSPSTNSLIEAFANITLCFGLIPNANISVIGVGWFLGTVFVFYLMFPFFVFLLSEKRRAWFSFFVSILFSIISEKYFGVDMKSISYSFAFFMVGGMIYLYRHEIEKLEKYRMLLLTLVMLTVFLFYTIHANTVISLLFSFLTLSYGMVVSTNSLLLTRLFRFIGNVSFEVYLCHMVIFRLLEKIHCTKVFRDDLLNYSLVVFVVMTGAIVFSLISKQLLKRANLLIKAIVLKS